MIYLECPFKFLTPSRRYKFWPSNWKQVLKNRRTSRKFASKCHPLFAYADIIWWLYERLARLALTLLMCLNFIDVVVMALFLLLHSNSPWGDKSCSVAAFIKIKCDTTKSQNNILNQTHTYTVTNIHIPIFCTHTNWEISS